MSIRFKSRTNVKPAGNKTMNVDHCKKFNNSLSFQFLLQLLALFYCSLQNKIAKLRAEHANSTVVLLVGEI